MSGGEKKRMETLQLVALKPQIAILDELDSGLDVDGLKIVSSRIEKATIEDDLGVLITHYSRLLEELKPDHVISLSMVGSLILDLPNLHMNSRRQVRKVDYLTRNFSITRRSLDHDPA